MLGYLKKIKPYNIYEKWNIFLFSIGSYLVNKVPASLKATYSLTRKLGMQGIEIKGEKETVSFTYPVNGVDLKFTLGKHTSDALVFEQIIILEEYRSMVSHLQKWNTAPSVMIDAGANVGFTSMYFKAFFPEIKIIAIEPSATTSRRLHKNIDQNGLKGVSNVRAGLWNKKTLLAPDHAFRDGLDWSFTLKETTSVTDSAIEVVTVTDIIQDHQLSTIDFFKMDIEGAEKQVLSAGADTRWLKKVKILALEIHEEVCSRQEMETLLKEHGFTLSYTGELTIGINHSITA